LRSTPIQQEKKCRVEDLTTGA